MARQSYYELLQHPKWQEKRLRVLERANFRCELCVIDTEQLHVHHTVYRKGKKPWEYEDHELLCLCRHCHESNESNRAELMELVGRIDRYSTGVDLLRITAYARCMAAEHEAETEGEDPWVDITCPGDADGVGDFFGLNYEELLAVWETEEGQRWGARFSALASLASAKRRAHRGEDS